MRRILFAFLLFIYGVNYAQDGPLVKNLNYGDEALVKNLWGDLAVNLNNVVDEGIPYKSDLALHTVRRFGLSLIDTVAGNNVSILTPVYQGQTGSTLTTNMPSADYSYERLFDGNSYTIYFKIKQITDVSTTQWPFKMGNNSGAERGMAMYIIGTSWYTGFADGTNSSGTVQVTNVNTTFKNAGWVEVFIEIDKVGNQARCTMYKEDGSGLGTNKVVNITSWTFNSNNNATPLLFMSPHFALYNWKKFSALKTLAQCRDNSYVTNLQLWYPEMLSGTDVSGNNHHMLLNTITDANRYYTSLSTYLLDKGYTVHKRIGQRDIVVPYSISGIPIYRAGYLTYNGDGAGHPDSYHETIEEPGSLTGLNLADCIIAFTGEEWKRSNVTIFDSACRASSYFDVGNPKRWHISELNKITLNSYTNINYQEIHFPKITGNSYDDRHLLTDIFTYSTNRNATQTTSVLKYTNDNDIINILFLSNPYSQVVKITANQNSEFKFNLNNSIVYSKSDIYNKIDKIPLQTVNEDKITSIFRWTQENVDINVPITQTLPVSGSVIHTFNSYVAGECGSLAVMFHNVLDNYYGTHNYNTTLPSHKSNYIDSAYFDIGYQFLLYDGVYKYPTIEEIKADKLLVTEPARMTGVSSIYSSAKWDEIKVYSRDTTYEIHSSYDSLEMKLPSGGTFVFPYKSANAPKNYAGADIYYGSGLGTFTTGITGIVQMPFNLTQITGTGTVLVDGTTYTLPTNNAALKTVLQAYIKFYTTFEILTNTGGISAEYIVNPRRMLLYNYNQINKGIISGDITVESVSTATPIPICYVAIDKKDAESWTLNHDQNKNMSGLFKVPLPAASNKYTINFNKTGTKIPLAIKFSNATANSLSVVKAGTPVIDQCFAAKLTPRNESFSSSTLQLTFTTYDGSSCYYTLDGSTPDATKTLYTGLFTISATTTVKWINIKTDYANSHINSRIITKN